MERIRFCGGCGEPFGWDLAVCPDCKRAVSRRRSRTSRRRAKFSWDWLTGKNARMTLLFAAVIVLLWLLSLLPMWLIE